jgi:hypothetical protein
MQFLSIWTALITGLFQFRRMRHEDAVLTEVFCRLCGILG